MAVLTLLSVQSDMVYVPSGSFVRGCTDAVCVPAEVPARTIELSGFWIDRTEATAPDFAAFLDDQGNPDQVNWGDWSLLTPPPAPGSAKCCPTIERYVDEGGGNHYRAKPGAEVYPANHVTWNGADAFCRWHGKRLPTEAEWEKAARGTDRRTMPWGSTSGVAPMNMQTNHVWVEGTLDALVPVDALPLGASPYGALNMAGNVWEWVADWFDPGYYAVAPSVDPPGPSSSPTRDKIIRGGSTVGDWSFARAYARTPHGPDPFPVGSGSSAIGVRCSWSEG